MKKLVFLIIFALLFSEIGWTQTGSNFSETPKASAYTYSGTMGDIEQLRIYTYVWGQVKTPGLYIVPDDTDLLALLSLAGGPTEDAKLSKVRIIRSGTNGEKSKIIWVNLKKFIDTADRSNVPILMPGDTIIVSGTVYYGLTKVTNFLSTIAVIFSVYSMYQSIKE